jgi:hypothetical protein
MPPIKANNPEAEQVFTSPTGNGVWTHKIKVPGRSCDGAAPATFDRYAKLAESHRPPKSWYDESTMPIVPE